MRAFFVCLFSALVSLAGVILASDYYVDADSRGGAADDAAPGTKDRPWKTLGRVSRPGEPAAGPGDTVWVRGGVYRETLTLSRGGQRDRPLALKVFPAEKATIDGEDKRYYGILVEGGTADHIVIEGFALVNHKPAYSGGTGAIKVLDRAGITIRHVDVSGAWCGVYFVGARDCQLLQSDIHHNAANVCVAQPSCGVVIADNHVHHSTQGDCIDVGGNCDSVMNMGRLVSVEPAGPGLARFTVADPAQGGLSLAGLPLNGRDAGGKLTYPHTPVLLFDTDGNPGPDGPEIAGGAVTLMDGRKWFYMQNNPEWGNRPCSPDGKQGLFGIGSAGIDELRKARYIYVGNTYAPAIRFTRDVQILRNDVHDSANQGILGPMTDGLLIRGNRIYNNGATGIQIETGARNVWIEDNISFANNRVHAGETGMWIDEMANGMVQNNVIYENNRSFMVSQSQRVIVRRNIVYRNNSQHVPADQFQAAEKSSTGFAWRGCGHRMLGAPLKTEGCATVHNTICGNGSSNSVWGTIASGVGGYPKVGSNLFLNNLVQGNLCPLTVNVAYSDAPTLDGNIYGADAPVKVRWNVDQDTTYVISETAGLEAYRKATGQDLHSSVQTVAFANAEAGDFRLTKSSPAVDAGVPLAWTLAAGKGTAVPVTDVRCFSAGFKTSMGQLLIAGDEIKIGNAKARIVEIDREKRVLTLDHRIGWKKDAPVSYLYHGRAPDVGALELGLL
jgi:hypothetical protein